MTRETYSNTALVVVVAFLRPRKVPIPLDFLAGNLLGHEASFSVGEIGVDDLGLVLLELGARVRSGERALEMTLDGCCGWR